MSDDTSPQVDGGADDPESGPPMVEIWKVHPAAVEDRVHLLLERGLNPFVPHIPSSILSKFYGSMTVKIYVPESEQDLALTVIRDYETQAAPRADELARQIVSTFVGVAVLAAAIALLAAWLGLQTGSSIMLGFWIWFLTLAAIGVRQRRSR